MLKSMKLFNPKKPQTQQNAAALLLPSFQQVSGRNCRFPAGIHRRNPLQSRYGVATQHIARVWRNATLFAIAVAMAAIGNYAHNH
ncbi:hypothetical protein HanRHA438_Chr00c15g0850121 [Helianthus annuus]|nr:hypothetical protein HanRHA438_Chr00c15g0850121 [Helianthus annuus]